MSRLDDLPPDQRATLSLLLASRKSYAEVATLLSIPQRAVHDRAHAALAVLAPRQAREVPPEGREQVGDYLLGQLPTVAERLAARRYLEGSPASREWASALASELEPLAGDALAEIPPGAERPPAPSDARPERAQAPAAGAPARRSVAAPSSRVGGALLLAAIVAGVVVAIVLIANSGGSSTHEKAAANASTGGETAASSTSTGAKAKEDKRITLKSPDPSSKAVGVAEVLSEGTQYAFYLAAEHLAPSKGKGFFYAVWLYNSPTSHQALSRSPEVGANGSLQGGALLPADAGKYHTMILTRETSSRPTSPGPVVLRGAFALH